EAFWRGIVDRFIAATRSRIEAEQAAGRVPAGLPAGSVAFALCWATERTLYQGLTQGAYEDSLVDALVAVWSRAVYGE
ncbi:MAG TPA: TetR/AcrR family transcriptional regulator, partial [Solirubrobacteraceae bacterium]